MEDKEIAVEEKDTVPEQKSEVKSSKNKTKQKSKSSKTVEVAGVSIDITPATKNDPDKKYSFLQWATRRDIKIHHRPGMKAFVKNPNKFRTLVEWDSLFEKY